MHDWLATCHALADALDPRWRALLGAFDGPDGQRADLAARIERALADEVDADQAALFSRRFVQVGALLAGMATPEAQLLAVFLEGRAAGILEAPGPRALRVRALVDFVFSHAAVAKHADPRAPRPEDLVRAAILAPVARGVSHATVAGRTADGPLHVNVLRLEGVSLRALDARAVGGDLVRIAAEHGAVAGFSGGFFLYSEADIAAPERRGDPVGALVDDGRVVGAPVFRRSALVQADDGAVDVRIVGPEHARFRVGGRWVTPRATNDASASAPCAFNRAFGGVSPRGEPSVAIASGRVVGVGTGLPIPLGGLVLVPGGDVGARVGDVVDVEVAGVRTVIGGGPRLVGDGSRDLVGEDFAGSAPPVTFSRDETFDTNLLPRLAVGVAGEVLYVVAVDGRDVDRAPGLTLRGTGALLEALGCDRATNLDGGSSKRMVVAGRVVDLPSTEVQASGQVVEERVRPVHSAVLVTAR